VYSVALLIAQLTLKEQNTYLEASSRSAGQEIFCLFLSSSHLTDKILHKFLISPKRATNRTHFFLDFITVILFRGYYKL
jgi:hypothetical protein